MERAFKLFEDMLASTTGNGVRPLRRSVQDKDRLLLPLPGLSGDDVELTLEDGRLVCVADKDDPHLGKMSGKIVIPLPDRSTVNGAEMKDGVLHVTLGPAVPPRKIEISAS